MGPNHVGAASLPFKSRHVASHPPSPRSSGRMEKASQATLHFSVVVLSAIEGGV